MTMTMTATTVTSATTARTATGRWTHVCDLDRLEADRGVTALVDGRHVAVFRLSGTDELLAIDNVDPFTGASVLSRGIVGAKQDEGAWVPYVASPLRKQRFSLRDGTCLDSPDVRVDVFEVQVSSGAVEIAACADEVR
ncbi:MAG: nitrite reductase small subunit NirD [Microthrixaceae bacterium]